MNSMSDRQESQETTKKSDTSLSKTKKWTRYLAEFTLVFLAVFLGFLTENYREKISEEKQARELALDLYDELRADSIVIYRIIIGRLEKDSALNRLKNYVLDSSLQKPSKEYVLNFYRGLMISPRFYPRDVVLEQLKNSGALRFKSSEIQHLIGMLSVAIYNLRTGNNLELEINYTQLIPFVTRHNDQRFFDRLTQYGSVSIVDGLKLYEEQKTSTLYHIGNLSEFNRETVSNMLGLHRHVHMSTTRGFYTSYVEVNKKLLAALRNEYKIK
jgi:hypothetical protein